MIFQSFSQLLQNNPSQHYSPESWTSQKTPWSCFYCCLGSLVAKTEQGRKENGDSGHGRARWLRGRGGGARGHRRGPVGGLGARGGGPWRRFHGGRRPAAVLCRCGGVPAVMSGGEKVGELPGGEVKPAAGLIWFGVGRRKGLDQSRGSGHAGSGDDFCSGEIGRAGRSGSFTGMRRS